MKIVPPLSKDGVPASTVHLHGGEWPTVLDALCARFPQIERAQWQDRMTRGVVFDAQGNSIGVGHAYRAGMRVHYFREVAAEAPIPFTEAVLYADEHLVIADKPHFLPVMPAGVHARETLQTRLIARFDNPHLVPLHRIDRATAGIVMLSCNPSTRPAYQALFREQRIRKRYEALAPPLPDLEFPLVRRSRIVASAEFFRMRETGGTPNSETTIDVIERGATIWRYALTPVTGRTHQLRVQMAGLGAAIIGDRWYPRLQHQAPDDHARPLQLLAQALEFTDPLDGTARRFESRLQLDALHGSEFP
jgi:tRNA pseudouridine32 synthase/23S rRNA pseudouridine746 synthase